MLGHVGDQIVEHAALAEQRMGSGLAGIGFERLVHAEALADFAEQRQQRDGEGADQQQPVAAGGLADAGGRQPPAAAEILGVADLRLDGPAPRIVIDQRGGEAAPRLVACTLQPYAPDFDLGTDLAAAMRPVTLNHPHCARFCVFGAASCSAPAG